MEWGWSSGLHQTQTPQLTDIIILRSRNWGETEKLTHTQRSGYVLDVL